MIHKQVCVCVCVCGRGRNAHNCIYIYIYILTNLWYFSDHIDNHTPAGSLQNLVVLFIITVADC